MLANDLTVFYTMSGSASNGQDYVFMPGSFVMPAGTRLFYLPIVATNDIRFQKKSDHGAHDALMCIALTRQNPSWMPLWRTAASTSGVMLRKARRAGTSNQSS